MLRKAYWFALGVLFAAAIAASYAWPQSVIVQFVLFALVLAALPALAWAFFRNVYTAVREGYVIPNDRDGRVYRSKQPITFWSNAILAPVMLLGVIVGGAVLANEMLHLAKLLLQR